MKSDRIGTAANIAAARQTRVVTRRSWAPEWNAAIVDEYLANEPSKNVSSSGFALGMAFAMAMLSTSGHLKTRGNANQAGIGLC